MLTIEAQRLTIEALSEQNKQLLELVAEAYEHIDGYTNDTQSKFEKLRDARYAWLRKINPEWKPLKSPRRCE